MEGCNNCIDTGGLCYGCQTGYTFTAPAGIIQTRKNQDDRNMLGTHTSPPNQSLFVEDNSYFCKKDCNPGYGWTAPNTCQSCIGECRRCQDTTLICIDKYITMEIEALEKVSAEYEDEGDQFLVVKFFDFNNPQNEKRKWNVRDGQPVDFTDFLQVVTLQKIDTTADND
jgi:hypothetical protein